MFSVLLPKDPCKWITKEKDKFSDEITYTSPIGSFSGIEPVRIMRVVEDSLDFTYLSLSVNGEIIEYDGKGVTILLDNGDKMSWDDTKIDIDYDVDNYNYEYSCFISLNREEIELLKKHNITDYKLYIFEKRISSKKGKKYRSYIECIDDITEH